MRSLFFTQYESFNIILLYKAHSKWGNYWTETGKNISYLFQFLKHFTLSYLNWELYSRKNVFYSSKSAGGRWKRWWVNKGADLDFFCPIYWFVSWNLRLVTAPRPAVRFVDYFELERIYHHKMKDAPIKWRAIESCPTQIFHCTEQNRVPNDAFYQLYHGTNGQLAPGTNT